jgi:putative RNA 2'-phosphotransferase
MKNNQKKMSKFMSLLLRHKPEVGGIILDERGCVKCTTMLSILNGRGFDVTMDDLKGLAKQSDDPNKKTRFEIEGAYIRAGHGHSIPISGYTILTPIKNLYHASPRKNVNNILGHGLRAMSRQKVHLAYDLDITVEAARRRSKDVIIIEVDTNLAQENGIQFYKSADERIVLSDDIPPEFLTIREVEDATGNS